MGKQGDAEGIRRSLIEDFIPQSLPDTASIEAKVTGENFPVAGRFLPKSTRQHLLAIYGFARFADDIGDEAQGDRLVMLDWLEEELERAVACSASHPLLVRLGETIRYLQLPTAPFHQLIEANRQDQAVRRYDTYEDLLGYCKLSAAPVGRLVLEVFGVATPARIAASDQVCAGLQIVEHLQDLKEDFARGRVYMPQEDLERFGCTEEDLGRAAAGAGLRRAVHFEAVRARRLLASSRGLCRGLPWRARAAVAGFASGGMAALDAMEAAGYDVLQRSCRPRAWRVALHAGACLLAAASASNQEAAPCS